MPPPPVLVVLAHANGLCKDVWWPFHSELLRAAAARAPQTAVRTLAIDLPGHGLTGPAVAMEGDYALPDGGGTIRTPDWDDCGRRVLAEARAAARVGERVVGVGLSLGGTACVMANELAAEQHGARPNPRGPICCTTCWQTVVVCFSVRRERVLKQVGSTGTGWIRREGGGEARRGNGEMMEGGKGDTVPAH